MRLNSIDIKNFKSIDEQGIHLDFAPITLLFGPNNVGKSTIIDTLHLTKEIFCYGNTDPDIINCADNIINLGGFKNFVHLHNLNKTVTIALELDLQGENLPFSPPLFSNTDHDLSNNNDLYNSSQTIIYQIFNYLNLVKFITIQYSINYGNTINSAYISEYTIFFNKSKIAQISCSETGEQLFTGIDFSFFLSSAHYEQLREDLLINQNLTQIQNLNPTNYSLVDLFYNSDDISLRSLLPIIDIRKTFDSIVPNSGQQLTLEPLHQHIYNLFPSVRSSALPSWNDSIKNTLFSNPIHNSFLTSILLQPGKMLRNLLQENFHYLGPFRDIPPRNFTPAKSNIPSRWATGLAAWDFLAKATPEELNEINSWLVGPNSLNMGYKLQINSLISFNASQQSAKVDEESTQNILRDTIQTNSLSTLLSNQPHEKRIIFKHCSTGVDVAPQEMGIGVSQIMPPIILAATTKSDSTIAISQPELHIHPRWQAVLGDVFLSTATQDSPPLIIIETHSELLMLRILRRVRQTAEETIPDGLPPVKPEIITVYYVQNKDQGGIEVFHAAITSSGDFDQNWPDGFFYERIDEVF